MRAQKKPLWRRWWFWLIIVLVILYAIGTAGGDDDAIPSESPGFSQTDKEPDTPKPAQSIEPIGTSEPSPSETAISTPAPTPVVTSAPTLAPTPEATPEPTPNEPTMINGHPSDMTVYVSSSGKIHSVSDCSGMKSSTPMSLGNAVASGFSFCSNCW